MPTSQYSFNNHEETFFLSSRELAKRYNVDAATIVRTVQALGYERFADFAADLRQHFVNQITPYIVLKAETQERRSVTDRVRHCLERDNENLSVLRSSLDAERVMQLAKSIHRSQRILVIGVDLAASLSWFLAYGLTPLGFDARAPVGSTGNLQHKIDVLTKKDLLIAISFGRCLRDTVEAAQRAHERGVPTFGITDSETTPIALRQLPGCVNQQSVLHGFVCSPTRANQHDYCCLRAHTAETSTCDVGSNRRGVSIGRAVVQGTISSSQTRQSDGRQS
jgi:DNA-binding MurR/RpiR family transcriptional regulator